MSYILVVDDEKDIRDLISQILFEEGHTVKLAQNSTTAIDYINREEPDLIVLDIWLKDSEMDGIEILKSCLLYTSPSPRDRTRSRMPSSA